MQHDDDHRCRLPDVTYRDTCGSVPHRSGKEMYGKWNVKSYSTQIEDDVYLCFIAPTSDFTSCYFTWLLWFQISVILSCEFEGTLIFDDSKRIVLQKRSEPFRDWLRYEAISISSCDSLTAWFLDLSENVSYHIPYSLRQSRLMIYQIDDSMFQTRRNSTRPHERYDDFRRVGYERKEIKKKW